MRQFVTDDELARRLEAASQRAVDLANELAETARLLGPEPDPDPRPEPEFPVRRSRHKQDRLPI